MRAGPIGAGEGEKEVVEVLQKKEGGEFGGVMGMRRRKAGGKVQKAWKHCNRAQEDRCTHGPLRVSAVAGTSWLEETRVRARLRDTRT